jgi:hypothetical protein
VLKKYKLLYGSVKKKPSKQFLIRLFLQDSKMAMLQVCYDETRKIVVRITSTERLIISIYRTFAFLIVRISSADQ